LTALLSIEHLTVRFGAATVVDDVSLTIGAGEKFALVGESGSGKSITALSVLGLVDGATTSGRIVFDGNDLRTFGEPQMRAIRGGEIAMIFQEPMTALNPLHTVGAQIVEVLGLHEGLRGGAARERAIARALHLGVEAAVGEIVDGATRRAHQHRAERENPHHQPIGMPAARDP